MRTILQKFNKTSRSQMTRYFVNGLVSTIVHFGVLQMILKVFSVSSVGQANFIATFFGIAVSFVGSRYFVFKAQNKSITQQIFKFGGLYLAIALMHGVLLYLWCDIQKWNYLTGFLLATVLQVVLSYWGNKLLVFNQAIV
jgi:putative flippase GtrA